MAARRLSGAEVWVLTWTGRYGTEVHVFSSERLAERAAARIVEDNFGDLRETTVEPLRALLRARRWADAVEMWNEIQSDMLTPQMIEIGAWKVDSFFGEGEKAWMPK